MKAKKILKLLLLLVFFSCQKNKDQETSSWTQITPKLFFQERGEKFYIKSGGHECSFPKEKLPFKKVVVLTTSQLGYISALGEEERISGIAGAQYVYSEKIRNLIQENKIQTVGTDQKYNLEKILALKADAVLTNYMPNLADTYEIFRKNGINVIFLDEYLEEKPLEKTAYIKLFGKLFGVEKKAEKIYQEIETNYLTLKNQAAKAGNSPAVLSGEMYGNHWFLAGGKTFAAQYFKDAGADYILKNNQDEKSVSMSFEEIFSKSQSVQYWVNLSNYATKKELLNKNPAYGKLRVFREGKIFAMNNRQKGDANDYFESGAVRTDLVLRDYIKIFHPEFFPNDTLVYMKELK